MANKVNIVLVHGAWGDGGHWHSVIPILHGASYTVVASQHPLTSLADDAETVRRLAESLEGPTLLVGHSYGGAVITEAASKCPNVVGLVFIAAFAPDVTESLGILLGRTDPPPGGANIAPDKYGFLWINREKFGESFCQDLDKDSITVMAAAQKPISGKCFEDKPTNAGWKNLPNWYQISEQDRMIPPATQQFLAERMKATTISLDTSHASLATRPKEVAELILKAAAELGK
ncbi:alpha/beta hydrolase [Chitinophaga sp. Mgbs1]|uniref:Alpha/beta hydrolase n=1 Tax=Chitinophaga solisilvae TaxID=1233460 RepID=A0A433WID5_9BACT|nr:alpha/beta hydrolase [Chitinophaga solisilvae]